jgi:hypothetical protein
VAKRGRPSRSSSLERLALYKARPINRDALRIVDYRPRTSKSEPTAAKETVRPGALRPKSSGEKSPKGTASALSAGGRKVRSVRAAEVAWRRAKKRQLSGLGPKARRAASAPPLPRKLDARSSRDTSDRRTTTLKCSPCPRCGGRKSPYYACFDCGFSLLPDKSAPQPRRGSEAGARPSKQPTERPSCKPIPSVIAKQRSKVALPEWEKLRPRDDVFDRGRVVSGGGVGVAKGKKR